MIFFSINKFPFYTLYNTTEFINNHRNLKTVHQKPVHEISSISQLYLESFTTSTRRNIQNFQVSCLVWEISSLHQNVLKNWKKISQTIEYEKTPRDFNSYTKGWFFFSFHFELFCELLWIVVNYCELFCELLWIIFIVPLVHSIIQRNL